MSFLTIRHVTTYRYRRPVAFGEHRMMLHPRYLRDQRVIRADLKISPEPTSLRLVQDAFGNSVGIARFSGRSTQLSFESIVCLEHSPCDLEDAGWPLPVHYSVRELRMFAEYIERHQSDPIRRGRLLGQGIPGLPRVDQRPRTSRTTVAGHPSRLPLQAAGSERNSTAVGNAGPPPWQLPRLCHC